MAIVLRNHIRITFRSQLEILLLLLRLLLLLSFSIIISISLSIHSTSIGIRDFWVADTTAATTVLQHVIWILLTLSQGRPDSAVEGGILAGILLSVFLTVAADSVFDQQRFDGETRFQMRPFLFCIPKEKERKREKRKN